MNALPPDVWERILVAAGPLALAPCVGACGRRVAACRIQAAMRASWARRLPLPWRAGAAVRVRLPCSKRMVAGVLQTTLGLYSIRVTPTHTIFLHRESLVFRA